MKALTRHVDAAADKINARHRDFVVGLQGTLEIGIEIGKLLEAKKQDLGHGAWLPWVEANLEFSDRSARNYMRLYANRDELHRKGVADLTAAYKLLTSSRPVLAPVDPVRKLLAEVRPTLRGLSWRDRLRWRLRSAFGPLK